MGRREKVLDPAAGPVQRFAHDLRELRRSSGTPTYREMARRTGYSAPTLSAAAAGERLPSRPVALAYATACGGNREEWEKLWRAAMADVPGPAAHASDDDIAPYPGLARFGPGDREHFFGRDGLRADLVALAGRRRFIAVVGASGSGKSSLLRAGLIPVLRESTGRARPAAIRILTPGEHPARTHAHLLRPDDERGEEYGGEPGEEPCGEPDKPSGDTVVVVDQFEETFTLCRDPAERAEFIRLLLHARTPGSRLRVIVAVRADFYGRCAEHHALADALKDATLLVGPMSPAQLREAVVGPATAERLIVERSLTARIVADVADEPGGLPLMSHALLETWRRRNGRTLTEAAYDAIGGVQGAIAHTAEAVFARFTEREARAAKALLLRLVSPGDGTPDTRRPADRAELDTTANVLERLVRARLLTVDDTTVNLAHEALITGWPRLGAWIEEDRDRLRLHRRLTAAARTWEELGRDAGALYRGAQLASAREAFGTRDSDSRGGGLNGTESDFLAASTDAHDRVRRAAVRTTRRLRILTVALSVLLCLAAVAGLTAWQQSRVNSRQATDAEARRIAAVAGTLGVTDPRTALRLSVAAWRIADLPETRSALFTAAAQRDVDTFPAPPVVAFEQDTNDTWRHISRDGRTLMMTRPDRVERWDLTTHRRLPSYKGLGALAGRMLSISDDGGQVAVRTPGGVRVWDLAAGRLTAARPFGGATLNAHFTPGGRTFVVHRRTPDRPSVQLWDPAKHRTLLSLPQPPSEEPYTQVSPDDRLLALCPESGRLQVWDVRERRRLPAVWADGVGAELCGDQTFRFTPDSRSIAAAGRSGPRVWDARSGKERPRAAGGSETASTSDIAFSADGTYAATATDGAVQVWRTDNLSAPVLRHPARGANALRLDIEGGVLRYEEGSDPAVVVRTVSLAGAVPRLVRQQPYSAALFSPDGDTLATTEGGRVQLRDGASGRLRATLPEAVCDGTSCPAPLMVFSADGRTFAYRAGTDAESATVVVGGVKGDGAGRLGSAVDVNGIGLAPDGRYAVISRAVHSPDSHLSGTVLERWPVGAGTDGSPSEVGGGAGVLAVGPEGHVLTGNNELTDPATRRPDLTRTPARVLAGEGVIEKAAFSRDGRFLAVSNMDSRVTVWDGRGRRRLAVLTRGSGNTGREPMTRPSFAFSNDGSRIAVGGADGTLRIWETAGPASAGAPLPTVEGPVLALAFTDGGTRLRVTTPRATTRTVTLAPPRIAEAVCERAGGGLSRDAWETHLPSLGYRETC
ncbi:nSTAND1 domain-containing NTPase [Streptomyces niveus]|uniref:nSTAND1 domain-containing NTPase n=1 Tax=Streptomyces niveus TaxID=193462 RepID=UPI003448143A